ncbi:phage recombination protein Bet [Nakamurella leprariae]|uniref:Phage recombination protein Bet n=1 Tax=Nakamurella leprariae TaxID=2803911 RepID=A0A938YCU3_9ACTN|nr:phage recombination protein Bet [Nakamurella leprariae]MBM9467241.1 phage recombination protein Bet [Nakamurella leprariae]
MTTSTTIEKQQGGALHVSPGQTEWAPEQQAALRQLGLEDATAGDMSVFLHVCQRTGLDPFARQLYMIGRKAKQWDPKTRSESWTTKYTIQAGIDGLRLVADRTGKYVGQLGPQWCGEDGQWRDVWLSDKPPAAARVAVLRQDFREPLWAVAIFREYAQTTRDGLTRMWAEKPALMIAKVAEALALRKAFPQDLSGIYTSEEMSQADQAAAIGGPAAPGADQGSTPPPALPEGFDEAVAEAIRDEDLDGLLDLHAMAVQAGHQVHVARIVAAGKQVRARIAEREKAAQDDVVDGEVVEDPETT